MRSGINGQGKISRRKQLNRREGRALQREVSVSASPAPPPEVGCLDDPTYTDNDWNCATWATASARGFLCRDGYGPVSTPERISRLLLACPVSCADVTPDCRPPPSSPPSPPPSPPPPSPPPSPPPPSPSPPPPPMSESCAMPCAGSNCHAHHVTTSHNKPESNACAHSADYC